MPGTKHPPEATQPLVPAPIGTPLSARDLTSVLIKHYGLHEGLYDLLVEFQISVGAVGPDPSSLSPGAIVGLGRIGLAPAIPNSSMATDAAVVNPMKKTSKKKDA